MIMFSLSSNNLCRIFDSLNRNRDGFVSLEELNWLLDRTRIHASLEELEMLVEAYDTVSVSVMCRPKPLANEALADIAVSTATKLQCFRVEADDAVSMSVMSRSKPLENEALADLVVSMATKLKCFRVPFLLDK
ncbi:hypothetical protein Droror1_Dr00015237, partial [Drosera rotundifolia]